MLKNSSALGLNSGTFKLSRNHTIVLHSSPTPQHSHDIVFKGVVGSEVNQRVATHVQGDHVHREYPEPADILIEPEVFGIRV